MMKEWLRGSGRQPANWATLVAVLRNAGFSELAGQVEQLVPTLTEGGRGGDRIKATTPSSLTDHQLHSLSQGERRGGREEVGGGGEGVNRGGGATAGGDRVQSGPTIPSNDQPPRGDGRDQRGEGGGGRGRGRGGRDNPIFQSRCSLI